MRVKPYSTLSQGPRRVIPRGDCLHGVRTVCTLTEESRTLGCRRQLCPNVPFGVPISRFQVIISLLWMPQQHNGSLCCWPPR